MSEICDLSAIELRRRIAAKEISPPELLDSCVARIHLVNPALNAIVAEDFEGARRAAKVAEEAVMRGEELGPLHGLPIGIKDLNETAGLKTTFGSPLYAEHVPARDDSITASIRAAGGIIAAKTNTPEFGAGANTVNQVYGFTGNPFDPARICGGSSGGSAVALATSMLPLASGSDLGGSLRTPAGYCGVVGFRPTPGSVPHVERRLAWAPLAVQGPMARSVADVALLLSVMTGVNSAGPLPADPLFRRPDNLRMSHPVAVDPANLKVAFSEDLGFAPVSQSVRGTYRERCRAIAPLFAACEAADPDMAGADEIFEVLRAVGFLAAYEELVERHPDQVGPNVTANVELGRTFDAADVARAGIEHTLLYRRFLDFMEDYDLLICPVTAVPPFGEEQLYPSEIDGAPMATYISWMGITYGLTLTTHPVAVVPCGLDETGTPFGLQLVGKWGEDRALLDMALGLEAALDDIPECRRPLPDLTRLTPA